MLSDFFLTVDSAAEISLSSFSPKVYTANAVGFAMSGMPWPGGQNRLGNWRHDMEYRGYRMYLRKVCFAVGLLTLTAAAVAESPQRQPMEVYDLSTGENVGTTTSSFLSGAEFGAKSTAKSQSQNSGPGNMNGNGISRNSPAAGLRKTIRRHELRRKVPAQSVQDSNTP